jgi:hypothetical protein
LNVLFVCSRNQWRSPTAEQIFAQHPGLSVRSGGTSESARRRVSLKDAQWADIILVILETAVEPTRVCIFGRSSKAQGGGMLIACNDEVTQLGRPKSVQS